MKGLNNVRLCSFSLRHQLSFEDQSYSLSLIGNPCLSMTAKLFQKALLLRQTTGAHMECLPASVTFQKFQLSTLCLPAGMFWSRRLLSSTFSCILTTVVRNRAALQSQLPNGLQVTRSTAPRTYMNILFQTHDSAPYHPPFSLSFVIKHVFHLNTFFFLIRPA